MPVDSLYRTLGRVNARLVALSSHTCAAILVAALAVMCFAPSCSLTNMDGVLVSEGARGALRALVHDLGGSSWTASALPADEDLLGIEVTPDGLGSPVLVGEAEASSSYDAYELEYEDARDLLADFGATGLFEGMAIGGSVTGGKTAGRTIRIQVLALTKESLPRYPAPDVRSPVFGLDASGLDQGRLFEVVKSQLRCESLAFDVRELQAAGVGLSAKARETLRLSVDTGAAYDEVVLGKGERLVLGFEARRVEVRRDVAATKTGDVVGWLTYTLALTQVDGELAVRIGYLDDPEGGSTYRGAELNGPMVVEAKTERGTITFATLQRRVDGEPVWTLERFAAIWR